MRIKVCDLVPGQIFRFPKNPTVEYVVNSQCKGDINCIKVSDYDKYPPGCRGRFYFTLSSFYTVEIPPYDAVQQSLF